MKPQDKNYKITRSIDEARFSVFNHFKRPMSLCRDKRTMDDDSIYQGDVSGKPTPPWKSGILHPQMTPKETHHTICTTLYAGIISMHNTISFPFLLFFWKDSLPVQLKLAELTRQPRLASNSGPCFCLPIPPLCLALSVVFLEKSENFFSHTEHFIVLYKPEFPYTLQLIKSETSQTLPLLFDEST